MQARTASLQIDLERFEMMAADRGRAAEMAETAVALKADELKQARVESQELRSQISALESTMQARTASLQIDLERFEMMAADRARAAEMAENAAALKAGELQRARAEIAALTARISSSSHVKRLWRETARRLGSLKPLVARPPVSGPGDTSEDPDRRS